MNEVATISNKLPVQHEAKEAAAAVHASDQAQAIARRIKDARMLEKALLGKLDAQRDFAGEYKREFPQGGDRKSEAFQDARSGVLNEASDDWCKSFGFSQRTVQRWCELLDAANFTEKKNAILDRCWKLAEMWQAANYSSESVEWYTPSRYLEAVREVLGEIDLDPASSMLANSAVGAAAYFTEEDDGLSKRWHGRVFMNPPYGKNADGSSLAGEFCSKALQEYEAGNISACIILVNSSHSQAWQAPLYEHTVCFVDHRIQFVAGDGTENKNPTFQNIFVLLGDAENKRRFADVFSRFGYVMERING